MKRTFVALSVAVLVAMAFIQPAAGVSTPLAPRQNVDYVTGSHTSTGGHVAVEGDRLYVGAYGLGMRIFDISNPASPVQIGQYMPGLRADAVPDATVMRGREIAVLNGTRRNTRGPNEVRTDKSEFLDVTNPSQPKLLWTFVGQDDGEAHNGDIFDRRKLWLPSGGTGENGLRIYSMRPLLQDPPQAPERLWPPRPCEPNPERTPPRKCDLVSLWEDSPYRGDDPVGNTFTHTHDIEIYSKLPVERNGRMEKRDIAFLAEGGNYTDNNGDTGSVFIIDITKPWKPVVLQRWLHERGPGHHPIRYHHEVQLLDGNPEVMLVTDEDLHNGCGNAGGAVAVRLSKSLTETEELSEWFIPQGTPAPVCSVHVFSSEENTVFIGSYNAGLQVVDYSDPANPQRVGYYVTEGTTAWGALYHKGVIYQGDVTRGLDVFRFTGEIK